MNPYGPFESKRTSKRTSKQTRALSPAEMRVRARESAKAVVRKHLKRGQLPYELHEALELLMRDM